MKLELQWQYLDGNPNGMYVAELWTFRGSGGYQADDDSITNGNNLFFCNDERAEQCRFDAFLYIKEKGNDSFRGQNYRIYLHDNN